MNKDVIKEMIEDLEQVAQVINNRIQKLYTMLGEQRPLKDMGVAQTARNKIKDEIEKQRNDMMSKLEQMRSQTMAQVQDTMRKSMGSNVQMPSITGMPMRPVSPSDMDKVKKELLKNMNIEEPKKDERG